MACVLIVGANRGIGLELCRQLSARGDSVLAACRHSSPELEALPGVEIYEGTDVTAPASFDGLVADVGKQRVDLLIVVAGILKSVEIESFDAEVVREQFEVNALGALTTTLKLLPCLKDGGKIGLLSSRMGSIADNSSGGSYGYRMSKAALNAAGRSLAIDLRPQGVAVGIVHPGWVRTDMTRGEGLIDAASSAQGIIERMDELDMSGSGKFVHQSGEPLPW
jgi:NAD(P)-dependent dehydrogenase (short-subunit alcohol dehydrogenase family)